MSALLRTLFSSMRKKVRRITDLMLHLPRRKFILIGDSGEWDPEVYRAIRVLFPARVSYKFSITGNLTNWPAAYIAALAKYKFNFLLFRLDPRIDLDG